MTTCTFHPARLHGTALVPPAKSEAHRALLLAALGQGPCRLTGLTPPLCQDVQAMVAGITALGARVEAQGDSLVVQPAPPPEEGLPEVAFHVHACAAALRMLIPVLWVRGQRACITMEEGLFARPLDALKPLAEAAGCVLEKHPAQGGKPPYLRLSGRLAAGSWDMEGSVSSQFASGLLMALPYARDAQGQPAPSTLRVLPPIASRPYLDMTLQQMSRFHLAWQETAPGRFALSSALGHPPPQASIQGDWSQGAVLLCANALGSGLWVENLSLPDGEACQGDARIVELLGQMGLCAYPGSEGLYMTNPSRAPLLPLTVDCTHIPDITPLLALACTQAQGISLLMGVARLRVKECDRLEATCRLLTQLGARVHLSPEGDTLRLEGPVRLRGGFTGDPQGDHRMVMLLAVAALSADGPVTVPGVEALDKSWPGFLEMYQRLGGNIS